MAKHPKRRGRRFRRYIKGKLELDCELGALAGDTLVSCVAQETASERMLISSIVNTWSLKDLDPSVDDGPLICGVAHSDYSAAEIEEVIENTGSWSEGDLVAQEVAKRKVRIVGTFQVLEGPGDTQVSVLNDGRPIKTKLNWILNTGQGLDFFVFNAGSGAIITGSSMHIYGHANLWPQ